MGIEPRSTLLNYTSQLLQLYNRPTTVIPVEFCEQVKAVKSMLKSDTSGLVNSILDFAISAANVPIKIDTSNKNLSKILNSWMHNINASLRGKVPVGIKPLAKEYFRERWKGSSLIALRTEWEHVGGFYLPTKCWVVSDSENLEIHCKAKQGIIGEEDYYYRIDRKRVIPLTSTRKPNEMTFIQRPYDSWGSHYPTPFLIQRGTYKNLSMLKLFADKGEKIVSSALEYLLLMKKGTEGLAKMNKEEFIYNKKELKDSKEHLDKLIADKRSKGGVPTHVSNFDTEFQELVPEYKKVVEQAIFSPVEKRILSSLGIVEIMVGSSNSRTEGLLNPKPFIADVNEAADDFVTLMDDLATEIIIRNTTKHPKYVNNIVTIHRNPTKELQDKDFKQLLRSLFDRGAISYQTLVEVVGEGDFTLETQRITLEKEAGINELMVPHPTQPEMTDTSETNNDPEVKDKNENENKSGPEKKNYVNANLNEAVSFVELEMAPYSNNNELPQSVKKLPSGGQTIWRKTFNSESEESEDELVSIKAAWSAAKKSYKKDTKTNKWVKK